MAFAEREADQPDDEPEGKPLPNQPVAALSRSSLRTLCLTVLVIVLFVYNDISRYLASLKLLTQGICREHYLEHSPESIDPDGSVSEDLCALPEVQQRLARLSGYMFSLEAALSFVFTIPYGLMLDRLSERLATALNLTGVLCSSMWLMLICFNWSIFPVALAVLTPIFSVIGGGFAMFDTVMMVIVARNVPSKHRYVRKRDTQGETYPTTESLTAAQVTMFQHLLCRCAFDSGDQSRHNGFASRARLPLHPCPPQHPNFFCVTGLPISDSDPHISKFKNCRQTRPDNVAFPTKRDPINGHGTWRARVQQAIPCSPCRCAVVQIG